MDFQIKTKQHRKTLLSLAAGLAILLLWIHLFSEKTRKTSRLIMLTPRVDRDRSHAEMVRIAQEMAPNLPILFWEEHKDEGLYYKNKSCARFPDVYKLKVNDKYWQKFTSKGKVVYLFGAYYDVRKHCIGCPAIRILALIDRNLELNVTYCQVWFAGKKEPVIVGSSEYGLLAGPHPSRSLLPILMTYTLPKEFENQAPSFVSLVNRMCDTASNCLRVIFDKPSKKEKFAVCVKMLDFLHEDQSVRLTEWIELVNSLGADKIFLYTLFVHENTTKVLNYYQQQGRVEVIPTSLVDDEMNVPYLQHLHLYSVGWERRWVSEVLQLNDCFYKNMYKYDFIAPFDTDEVIVPKKENNWTALMDTILKGSPNIEKKFAYYATYMKLFPHCENGSVHDGEIPPHMYMLQHVFCDKNNINLTPKSFFDTEIIQGLHNHRAMKCLQGPCKSYDIPRKDAELFHYRDKPYRYENLTTYCVDLIKTNTTDTTLWKYKEEVIYRSIETLYDLGFYD